MATTYLAPGVYVEEIPALQQPIGGVGTNTVGFIGMVPESISVPVPNADYDPVVALALAGGAPTSDAEVQRLKGEIKSLEDRQPILQKAIDQTNTSLADPNIPPDQKAKAERDRDRRTNDLNQNKQDVVRRQAELTELQSPSTAATNIRPYGLQVRQLEVDPYDARLCTNFSEYVDRFGTFSADDPAAPPGTAIHAGHRALTHAVYGFFQNGGTRCFVVCVRTDNGEEIDKALNEFESINAIAIVAAPGFYTPAVWDKLIAHCDKMGDRFAILDSPPTVGDDDDLDIKLLNYDNAANVLPSRTKNGAYYFPHIQVLDPAKQLQDQDPARNIPLRNRGQAYVTPSGHMAGIYARVDEQRGVHKAPANEVVRGALDVKYYIGKPKQELLNPEGVNCIRNMNGNIVSYGARTVGGDRNGEWKYVSVRRVFLYIRDSIDEGTQWAVFEPNDQRLWGKLKLNVSAFLTNVWRSGALFGATPQEAFFVKCDAENNPVEVRDVGQVVIEIGIAIVRPAEFVIFRVSQWAGPAQTS